MKRKWAAALALGILLSSWPMPALAAEETQLAALETYLHDEIRNGNAVIEFDSGIYGRPSEEELRRVFTDLFNAPDMFVLDGSFSWSARGTEFQVLPRYRNDILSDYAAAKERYETGVQGIADLVNPAWTDLQKVIFVHDCLALRFAYDTGYTNYDVHSFLRDGKGVCEAYSLLMMAVLERLGIDSSYVKSDSINHMWNIVCLDGLWYHLDVTWDDPMPDRPGYARHVFFLLSTQAMKAAENGEHYQTDDWTFGRDVVCDSTRYDGYFWRNSVSPFAEADGQWYYVDSHGLRRWDGLSDISEEVLSFLNLFRAWYPNYTFQGYASTAGLFLYDGKLYFNTAFQILSYDLFTGAVERLQEFLREGNILSCTRDGQELVWQTLSGGVTTESRMALPPPREDPPGEQPVEPVMQSRFSDVLPESYCFDAVNWAVDRQITYGTSETTFSPDDTCTTAQVLTFLWRAAGAPVPAIANPFPDVEAGRYYEQAAAWAAQNHLLPDRAYFHPDAPCTRADAVGYLWALAGYPQTENIAYFTDVSPEDAPAVNWAVERGITRGTFETLFSPDNICTRGQIATFLYRDFA